MDYEVVVVGGGIGGLTTAALLAKRGVSVCLFERQSRAGGCVANFEHLGYSFEPTAGLYSGWQTGGLYERLFSELSAKAPEIRRLSPAYIVRLPDRIDVPVSEDWDEFAETLRRTFPECAEAAVSFYRNLFDVAESWLGANSRLRTWSEAKIHDVLKYRDQLTSQHLTGTSPRFRRFVDVQLQTFTQSASDECSYLYSAIALTAPHRGLWAIRGGAQTLADALAGSLKQSGGVLRLNSPVLRLAYGPDGAAIGVDLLSGERITATRAIVSNLTIWDTYGKLIGLSRTPASITAHLKRLRGWGAYLLFAGMNEAAASRLSADADHFLVLTDLHENLAYEPDEMQLVFSAAPQWDPRAPMGHRAVTILTFTDVEDWFSFHEDETAHEKQDQMMLETSWNRLHSALPELGDGIEVIETATPRTFYETTRRRLGMVGAPGSTFAGVSPDQKFSVTHLPNVFLVGDTVCPGSGLEAVCQSAFALTDHLVSSPLARTRKN